MRVMITKKNITEILSDYSKKIPRQIRQLLVPGGKTETKKFGQLITDLAIKEKERNYIMEIQLSYDLPLRPNDSLKATMITARLKILQMRKQHYKKLKPGRRGNLPVDPLE